ncbi:hypothetical protein SUGI_0110590 [Cryptomeria japonica]|uniref:uncharacterized protein LOC131078840 isoform X2 n=1 Tax=Cryptomeria japonica TaxID=3369 RepID=UPI002408D230|nr:uncharacterized protein LOC131078840 isoform X2 [Cryptomeria japonica]GLJ09492.1 hypothetical protein SUGI_0110590 [Cryptomeria japonica]
MHCIESLNHVHTVIVETTEKGMALSSFNSAILGRPECSGSEVKLYANAVPSNGIKTSKPVKIKALQIKSQNTKIGSQRSEVINLQPCLVRREALLGFGASLLTILVAPAESAEARTVKVDMKKKILEKLDELREKAGLKKKNEDEKSSADSEETRKSHSELAQKREGLLVDVGFWA